MEDRQNITGANLLANNPDFGRSMDDDTGRRELFIAFGAGGYILRYRHDKDRASVIIRVWHCREQR